MEVKARGKKSFALFYVNPGSENDKNTHNLTPKDTSSSSKFGKSMTDNVLEMVHPQELELEKKLNPGSVMG